MAGKSAGFAIGVGINDAASAGLDAINKRIAALTAPAERFNKSLAKFGDVTGINRAAEGMQTLGDRALGAARAVERLAGPMVGITSAASLGGMVGAEPAMGRRGQFDQQDREPVEHAGRSAERVARCRAAGRQLGRRDGQQPERAVRDVACGVL